MAPSSQPPLLQEQIQECGKQGIAHLSPVGTESDRFLASIPYCNTTLKLLVIFNDFHDCLLEEEEGEAVNKVRHSINTPAPREIEERLLLVVIAIISGIQYDIYIYTYIYFCCWTLDLQNLSAIYQYSSSVINFKFIRIVVLVFLAVTISS